METITLDKTEIISNFVASGEAFVKLVSALPETLLDASAAPGEWTVRQIVHHVADDADAWCLGFKKAIANPGAPLRFEGFPGNERWFAALGFDRRPVGPALALIQAHRLLMADIAACAPQDWSQSFLEVFDDKGQSMGSWPIGQMLAMFTAHIREHTTTIQTIQHANFAIQN